MLFKTRNKPTVSLKPLVVIVDDEQDICKMLELELTPPGYDVASAFDGESGLALIRERRPAVVLLDIKMPRMNGYQVLAQMQQDPELSAIPVIVMTSLTDDAEATDADWAERLGVNLFISKPMETSAVVQAIERTVPIPSVQ